MDSIPLGAAGTHQILVTAEVAIDFLGNPDARVLSTPHLIGMLEWTARNTIQPFLEPGWDSVGTIVNVRHLGASPIGMSVRFEARVTAIDGNRVSFTVEAWDDKEKVGEGTHERFVIFVPKFVARLAAKRAQA